MKPKMYKVCLALLTSTIICPMARAQSSDWRSYWQVGAGSTVFEWQECVPGTSSESSPLVIPPNGVTSAKLVMITDCNSCIKENGDYIGDASYGKIARDWKQKIHWIGQGNISQTQSLQIRYAATYKFTRTVNNEGAGASAIYLAAPDGSDYERSNYYSNDVLWEDSMDGDAFVNLDYSDPAEICYYTIYGMYVGTSGHAGSSSFKQNSDHVQATSELNFSFQPLNWNFTP